MSGLGGWGCLREELCCSICLDVYTEPLTLSCGHSFCSRCLDRHWSGGGSREHSCPECRTRFPHRPQLSKSISLARLCAAVRAAPGPRAAALCPLHHRRLELYCLSDRSPVCAECGIRQHRGHQLLTVEETAGECGKLIQKRLEEVKERLDLTIKQISARSTANQTCVKMADLGLMGSQGEGEETEFREREGKVGLSEVAAGIDTLERQREELRQELEQLQQLLNTEDLLQRIQGYQGLKVTKVRDMAEGLRPDTDLRTDIAELPGPLAERLSATPSPNPPSAETYNKYYISPSGKPEYPIQSRTVLLQYLVQVRFNPDTVSEQLRLCEGDLTLRNVHPLVEDHPDHPDRFQDHSQALGTPALSSGWAYWEVRLEWSGKRNVKVGVASGDMSRKGRGPGSMLGRNSQSWCLHLTEHSLDLWHNNEQIVLEPDHVQACSLGPGLSRECTLGLLLDFPEGRLTFYQVTHDLRLIHSFQFQPRGKVFPAFLVGRENNIHLKP